MVSDEKGDQHAGHQADAAEGSEGDGEAPGQGPSCALNRSTHIFMIRTAGLPRLSTGSRQLMLSCPKRSAQGMLLAPWSRQ